MTQNKIQKWLSNLCSRLLVKIVFEGILYLSSLATLLVLLKNKLQEPIPLWLVIVISLSILFGCGILFLVHSYKKPPKVRNKLFDAVGFKWETTFQKNSILQVSDIPFCKIHALRLSKFKDIYRCTAEKDCKTSIEARILPNIHEVAFNHIERYIRNKC